MYFPQGAGHHYAILIVLFFASFVVNPFPTLKPYILSFCYPVSANICLAILAKKKI